MVETFQICELSILQLTEKEPGRRTKTCIWEKLDTFRPSLIQTPKDMQKAKSKTEKERINPTRTDSEM
jgi:hypothetical protein